MFSIAACLIAAAASWSRGGRYVAAEHEAAGPGPVGAGPMQADPVDADPSAEAQRAAADD